MRTPKTIHWVSGRKLENSKHMEKLRTCWRRPSNDNKLDQLHIKHDWIQSYASRCGRVLGIGERTTESQFIKTSPRPVRRIHAFWTVSSLETRLGFCRKIQNNTPVHEEETTSIIETKTFCLQSQGSKHCWSLFVMKRLSLGTTTCALRKTVDCEFHVRALRSLLKRRTPTWANYTQY